MTLALKSEFLYYTYIVMLLKLVLILKGLEELKFLCTENFEEIMRTALKRHIEASLIFPNQL